MMNNDKKLRFIHITKCAGTSIESLINTWGRHDKVLKESLSKTFPSNVEWWHVPPKWAGISEINKLKLNHDFFVVVRNPYSRIISEYYCQWGGPKIKANTEHEFNTYITEKLEEVLELHNMGERIHGHWCPQSLYVENDEQKLLLPYENILKFENLNNDFDALIGRYSQCSDYKGLSLIQKVNKKSTDSIEGYSTSSNKKNEGNDKIEEPETQAEVVEKRVNECKFVKKFTERHLNKRNLKLILKLYKRDFDLFGYDTIGDSGSSTSSSNGSSSSSSSSSSNTKAITSPSTTTTTATATTTTAMNKNKGKRLSLQDMLAMHKSKKNKHK